MKWIIESPKILNRPSVLIKPGDGDGGGDDGGDDDGGDYVLWRRPSDAGVIVVT